MRKKDWGIFAMKKNDVHMNIRIDEYARSWLCSCAHFQPFVFIQETFNGFHIRFLWSHPPPPPSLMQPPPFLLIHSSRLIIPKIIRIYNYLCRIISSYLLILSPSYIIYFHLLDLNVNIVVLLLFLVLIFLEYTKTY